LQSGGFLPANKKAMAELSQDDLALIEAARAAIAARYRPDWHVVGAALRLCSGEVVTGVHLDAHVRRIAVCAEAVALGRAVTEFGSSDIEAIVAVYHESDGGIAVVAPCGMCREMISDYAPDAAVIMPDGDGTCSRRPIASLIPGKYRRGAPCVVAHPRHG
jgi:cytidine deaminase